MILFNNAPAFQTLRERYSPVRLRERFIARHRAKAGASVSDEDSAEWDRVPTKIPMDEMLSIDLAVRPDVPDRTMPKGGTENDR